MRDLFVTLAVFGTIPFILARPHIGILVWSWLSFMNPHRLCWGFATTMPFAEVVAITLMMSYAVSKEPKRIPITREVVVLFLFVFWMFLTTLTSLVPEAAWYQWGKVWRIQLVTLLTLMLMYNYHRIQLLVWTIALSIGFYGVKGGIWILATGGGHRVMGPLGTFIGGNNEIGLALIMIVPLFWYLQLASQQKWLKYLLNVAIALTLVAIVGTHSRGALLGIGAMGAFLLWKSRKRMLLLLGAAAFVLLLPHFMPEHWFERMQSIENYEEDASAQGRLISWQRAYELAKNRFMGGGYEVMVYGVRGSTDAHSIYFEVLAEHGFVGLALFLMLGVMTYRTGTHIVKQSKGFAELRWAGDLARMLQVSLVGYAATGTFLGLAYFDLYYALVVIMVLTSIIVKRTREEQTALDEHSEVAVAVRGSPGRGELGL